MPGLDYSQEVADGSSVSRGTLPQEQTMEESTPLLSLLFLLLSGYAMEPHTHSLYQACMRMTSHVTLGSGYHGNMIPLPPPHFTV